MKYSTIAVIYNPNSTGQSEVLARRFATQMNTRIPGQKVELIKTEYPGHGEELAYKIAVESKTPLIISSSGDGGYCDVVNGVMKAQKEGYAAVTGLLPAGNANDHYNSLHKGDSIKRIRAQDTKKIDVLKISSCSNGKSIERYAHSYIGFGLTPAVGLELNKTKLNAFNEVIIVLRALFTVKPVRLKVEGKTRAYESIIFSNVDVMSKYLKISRASSVTDGKFEVTTFRRRNKLRLLLILVELSLKGVAEDKKTNEYVLRTTRETLVQTDGEVTALDGNTKTIISIEHEALECII